MTEKKEDRRRLKTRAHIIKAFEEIVMDEGYEAMNVLKLTQKAQINRSTFYDHYPDLESLYHQVIDEVMDEFTGFLVVEAFNVDGTLNFDIMHSIVVNILNKISERREFLQNLIQTSDVRILKERIVLAIVSRYHHNIDSLAFSGSSEHNGELLIFYLSSVLYGFLNYWISAKRPISSDEMARSMIDLVLHGYPTKKSESI